MKWICPALTIVGGKVVFTGLQDFQDLHVNSENHVCEKTSNAYFTFPNGADTCTP